MCAAAQTAHCTLLQVSCDFGSMRDVLICIDIALTLVDNVMHVRPAHAAKVLVAIQVPQY